MQAEFQTDHVRAVAHLPQDRTAGTIGADVGSVTDGRRPPASGADVGALQVNHQGQQPSMTISFNLAPGYSLGQAVDAIRQIERDMRLPASITTGLPGGSRRCSRIRSRDRACWCWRRCSPPSWCSGFSTRASFIRSPSFPACRRPASARCSTLILFRMDLSVIAMIGIVMLVGIVKKNAIMMIDFAIERRARRHERRRGDPRGMPVAVPADHDDELRGDLRCAADRARRRRRRRAASAARRRGGRRPAACRSC